jgi:hypothetical protein
MTRQEPVAAVEPAETDPARIYASLAAVEDLDAFAVATSDEGGPLIAVAPAPLAPLGLVKDLEDAPWAETGGEGADLEALAHRYEGLDVDEIEALASYGEGTDVENEPTPRAWLDSLS